MTVTKVHPEQWRPKEFILVLFRSISSNSEINFVAITDGKVLKTGYIARGDFLAKRTSKIYQNVGSNYIRKEKFTKQTNKNNPRKKEYWYKKPTEVDVQFVS